MPHTPKLVSDTRPTILERLRNTAFVGLGAASVGMGINGFLLSSHFIDGGVTGISMLLTNIFGFPISLLLVIINVPFIILGYYKIGLPFAIKTSLGILTMALCLAVIPYPDVTDDKLLSALFGGFFIGTGIGLAMRGGAVLDGTEIAAVLVSKNSMVLNVSDTILLMNVIIFSIAAFFLGVEPALYSIVTYFAAAKMIDFVVNGIEEYTGVTIVSGKSDEIKQMIIAQLDRGVTVYRGKSGFGKRGQQNVENDIIYTVMTRLEVGKLQSEVNKIDPLAFIIYQSINDIKGGIIKKRALSE
jgi:uncharacterized membrane-anchored protein YitT (DUF2179 family)